MKVVAFTALHYGKPYLKWAMRSVLDYVDEYVVVYSDVGSHGHRTKVPPPDRPESLYEIARQTAGDKLLWYSGRFDYEGQQRDKVFDLVPDADMVIVVDSDEIWSPHAIEWVYGYAADIILRKDIRQFRMPMIHYWRSFHRAVLHDPAYPVRVICPKANEGAQTLPMHDFPINHMGYAIPSDLMRYKWLVHGHKNELRQDIDWFQERWDANAQRDCHPVGSEYWNPETVNPLDTMPEWMQEHPYFGLEVIP